MDARADWAAAVAEVMLEGEEKEEGDERDALEVRLRSREGRRRARGHGEHTPARKSLPALAAATTSLPLFNAFLRSSLPVFGPSSPAMAPVQVSKICCSASTRVCECMRPELTS